MPHVPLMEIAIRLVCGYLSVATIWRTSVIIQIRMFFYDRGQNTFIDVACGKIGLPKVGLFVFVVEI
jgi:hypothetical protein